jgi:SAM-dependent methyltransferase
MSALLPPALAGVDLGEHVLGIGAGFGATTRVLVDLVPELTSLEIDEASVCRLRAEFADRVEIVHGDDTDMPFPDRSFSSAVCFTMLYHIPSPQLQDRLFAEVGRGLRPGGMFHGVDSQPSPLFRLLHLVDTMIVLDPAMLAARLTGSELTDASVCVAGQVSFLARAPG